MVDYGYKRRGEREKERGESSRGEEEEEDRCLLEKQYTKMGRNQIV